MSIESQFRPLQVRAGVQPSNDCTPFSTEYYTYADKVRFQNGYPQKLGGWKSLIYTSLFAPTGTFRRIYSLLIKNTPYTLYASNERLYSSASGRFVNISPVSAIAVTAPNSLSTEYGVLSANPISTTTGSNLISVSDPDAAFLRVGDIVTLSGATAVGGITAAQINAAHVITAIQAGGTAYSCTTGGMATSTTTGGSNAVNRASGLIMLTKTAHGLTNDARVSVSGATATGGITAPQINREFNIRVVSPNAFAFMTDGLATSAVTGGGGAGTFYYQEIPAGAVNESSQSGYGAGLYGAGLYGVPSISTGARTLPRVWSMDRFGDRVVMTPGNQGRLYVWSGDPSVAPAPITSTGAPTAINYAFVSNNILVTLGQDTENFIFASDIGDYNQWVSSSTNQVFRYAIAGSGRLICHAPLRNMNLLFSDTKTFSMRKLDTAAIWEIKEIDPNIGIISQQAAVVVEGVPYWMDDDNWYMYTGSTVDVIPSATQSQATCRQYVLDTINLSQKSKVFGWYNKKYNEIWWHYPSLTGEPDSVIRLCLDDMSWTTDTFDRTAAESPNQTLAYPQLASSTNKFYYHEYGVDADGAALPFKLVTNLMTGGKNVTNVQGFIPDSVQNMAVTVTVDMQLYPQSMDKSFNRLYQVDSNTTYEQITAAGRYWRYTIEGNALGQNWQAGQWQEDVQMAGNK